MVKNKINPEPVSSRIAGNMDFRTRKCSLRIKEANATRLIMEENRKSTSAPSLTTRSDQKSQKDRNVIKEKKINTSIIEKPTNESENLGEKNGGGKRARPSALKNISKTKQEKEKIASTSETTVPSATINNLPVTTLDTPNEWKSEFAIAVCERTRSRSYIGNVADLRKVTEKIQSSRKNMVMIQKVKPKAAISEPLKPMPKKRACASKATSPACKKSTTLLKTTCNQRLKKEPIKKITRAISNKGNSQAEKENKERMDHNIMQEEEHPGPSITRISSTRFKKQSTKSAIRTDPFDDIDLDLLLDLNSNEDFPVQPPPSVVEHPDVPSTYLALFELLSNGDQVRFNYMTKNVELFKSLLHEQFIPAIENLMDFNENPDTTEIENLTKNKVERERGDGCEIEIPLGAEPVILPFEIEKRKIIRSFTEKHHLDIQAMHNGYMEMAKQKHAEYQQHISLVRSSIYRQAGTSIYQPH